MDKRLFVAINLPVDLKLNLVKWQQACQADSRWRQFKIRWTPADNLHITVVFLGKIAEEQINKLTKALSLNLRSFLSFELKFNNLAWAPPRGRQARMIWTYGEAEKRFTALVNLIRQISSRFVSLETRAGIYPHITLARLKQPVEKARQVEIKPVDLLNYSFKVIKISLMESKLTINRPFYYELASFKLAE